MKYFIPVTISEKPKKDYEYTFAFVIEDGTWVGSFLDMNEEYLLKSIFIQNYTISHLETEKPTFFIL